MSQIHQPHFGQVLVGLFVGVLASLPVGVQARTWTNTVSGSWEGANNWNPVGAPANADAISITTSGNYTVNVNNTTANTGDTSTWMKVGSLTVDGATAPLLLLDFTNTTKQLIATGVLTVGNGSSGALTINNGSMDAPTQVQIGSAAGGNGTFTMNGGTFSSEGSFIVATDVHATGTVVVTGGTFQEPANTFLGYAGRGTWTQNGGTVTLSTLWDGYLGTATGSYTLAGGKLSVSSLEVGYVAGATGTLTMNGGTLTGGSFVIGDFGSGTFLMNNGTLDGYAATTLVMGNSSTGTGRVDMTGGWIGLNHLQAGVSGTGQFNLLGGTNRTAVTIWAGVNSGSTGTITVNGGLLQSDTTFYIGNSGNGTLVVSNGLAKSVGGVFRVGVAAGGQGTVNIYGGEVDSSTTEIGLDNSSTGRVLVRDTGILQVSTFTLGTAGGGLATITNRDGGTLRFVVDNPSFTLNNASAKVVVQDATVEFKSVANANLTGGITNITYVGNNTLRLNSATNASPGSMTFQPGNNFAKLALVNGSTRWNSSFLTVGAGGSLSLSNTHATVSGVVTNLGTFRSDSSTATFEGKVVNSGAWITDPTTLTFNGDYSLTSTGYLQMAAGDVYIFKSNFVNQSTQNSSYDTGAGKFLFNGTGLTQMFFTAGKDFGPEAGYTPGRTNNVLPGPVFGTGPGATNFALGTLEISNSSTVKVADAFSVALLNDDSTRAALYLDQLILGANSLLIVDTNVTVYFRGSNDWAAVGASALLVGDAELHQLVPEPSILLLVLGGALTVFQARRKRMV